jgi:hypothetical protein
MAASIGQAREENRKQESSLAEDNKHQYLKGCMLTIKRTLVRRWNE